MAKRVQDRARGAPGFSVVAMTFEHPVRFPPRLSRSERGADGLLHPVMERPSIECGQKVQLAGKWVVCIRDAGHPVFLDWGHTNGYEEWCFDAPKSP